MCIRDRYRQRVKCCRIVASTTWSFARQLPSRILSSSLRTDWRRGSAVAKRLTSWSRSTLTPRTRFPYGACEGKVHAPREFARAKCIQPGSDGPHQLIALGRDEPAAVDFVIGQVVMIDAGVDADLALGQCVARRADVEEQNAVLTR